MFAVGSLGANGGSAACAADARVITNAEETYAALHAQYASEAGLVSAGQLHDLSSMHDVALTGGQYTIVAVGRCIDSGSIGSGTSAATGIAVKLLSSTGTGLPGAQVEYLNGSWLPVGTTGSDGTAASVLSSGTYQFRIDYRGGSQTLPATAVAVGTPIQVHTVAVSVALNGGGGDHSGAAITHLGNDGYWMTDDSTDGSGAATLELLKGTYIFRADYHGQTNLLAPLAVSSPTAATFPLTTVTVGAGEAAAPVEHRANNGEWIPDGVTNASNNAPFDALAGAYTVRAHRSDNSQPQTDALVSGAAIAVNLP